MRRILLLISALVAFAAPTLAHLSFNLAVDAEGNVYFLDVFSGRLMRVTAEGSVSELADFWSVAPGVTVPTC